MNEMAVKILERILDYLGEIEVRGERNCVLLVSAVREARSLANELRVSAGAKEEKEEA